MSTFASRCWHRSASVGTVMLTLITLGVCGEPDSGAAGPEDDAPTDLGVDATPDTPALPGPLASFLTDVRNIAGLHMSVCALLADHRVACRGSASYGQTGTGATTSAAQPTPSLAKESLT